MDWERLRREIERPLTLLEKEPIARIFGKEIVFSKRDEDALEHGLAVLASGYCGDNWLSPIIRDACARIAAMPPEEVAELGACADPLCPYTRDGPHFHFGH